MGAVISDWPLVGRSEELALAAETFETRPGNGLVIVGAPGVGKTRLSREVIGALNDGRTWLRITASSGLQDVALGAFSHLLPAGTAASQEKYGLWRQVAVALRAVAGSTARLGLLVDDAQWLDPLSAGLVHHLAATGQADLVVTLRAAEQAPEPVVSLWKDRLLHRLELQPLGRADVGLLLEKALGAPVEPRTASQLAALSDGNVLFLRELVDHAVETGGLECLHGAWVMTRPLSAPRRLIELVTLRLARLRADERRALEFVALAGELPIEALPHLGADASMADLEAAALVTIGDRTIRLAHPLTGEALLADLPSLRRRALVAELLPVLEGLTETDPAAAIRLALWRLDVGAPSNADQFVRGAAIALSRCAFDVAERLGGAAVDAGAAAAGKLCVGEALLKSRRPAEAADVLASISNDGPSDNERARCAMLQSLALGGELGRVDEAVVILREALASVPPGPDRNLIEAFLASLLVESGRFREGGSIAEARIAAIADDEVAALWSVMPAGFARTGAGRPLDAIEMCDRLLPVAVDHAAADSIPMAWVLAQRAAAMFLAGRLGEANVLLTAAEQFAQADGDPTLVAGTTQVLGRIALTTGRTTSALRLLRQAAAILKIDDRHGLLASCLAEIATALAQLGDAPGAAAAVAEAMSVQWPHNHIARLDIDTGQAWALGAQGGTGDAVHLLQETANDLEAEGMLGMEALARYEAFRIGAPPTVLAPRFRALGSLCQGQLVATLASHVIGAAEEDGAALSAAADAFSAMGHQLSAAEASSGAVRLFGMRGLRARAAQAMERRATALTQCEGPRTPLLELEVRPAHLTAREREVATLAGAGLSNSDIATRLGLSIRTVETHVQRAFEKLGVNRRTQLAEVLGPA